MREKDTGREKNLRANNQHNRGHDQNRLKKSSILSRLKGASRNGIIGVSFPHPHKLNNNKLKNTSVMPAGYWGRGCTTRPLQHASGNRLPPTTKTLDMRSVRPPPPHITHDLGNPSGSPRRLGLGSGSGSLSNWGWWWRQSGGGGGLRPPPPPISAPTPTPVPHGVPPGRGGGGREGGVGGVPRGGAPREGGVGSPLNNVFFGQFGLKP